MGERILATVEFLLHQVLVSFIHAPQITHVKQVCINWKFALLQVFLKTEVCFTEISKNTQHGKPNYKAPSVWATTYG